MKEYRVEIKVKNNKILNKMSELGIASVKELAKSINSTEQACGSIINLRVSPYNRNNEFKLVVIRMAELFGCLPEDLLTKEQIEGFYTKNKIRFESDLSDLQIAKRKEEKLDFTDNELIEKCLDTLTPREKHVIQCRFYESLTLEETAACIDVTRERARQIENKAIKKLRNPRFRNALKPIHDAF